MNTLKKLFIKFLKIVLKYNSKILPKQLDFKDFKQTIDVTNKIKLQILQLIYIPCKIKVSKLYYYVVYNNKVLLIGRIDNSDFYNTIVEDFTQLNLLYNTLIAFSIKDNKKINEIFNNDILINDLLHQIKLCNNLYKSWKERNVI